MVIDPGNVTFFAFLLAFAAGLVSFLSPCVLPLVPAYIGYLGARSIGTGVMATTGGTVTAATRRNTFINAVFFVLGFSLVFILLGATIGLVGYFLTDLFTGLMRAGAALLIVFGLRVANIRLSVARWALLGLVAAVTLYLITMGIPPTFDRKAVLDALMVFVIVLAGATMPMPFRLPLAVSAGLLNLFASPFGPLSPNGIDGLIAEPVRLFALMAETVLIMLIVLFVSTSDFFYMEKRFEMSQSPAGNGVMGSLLMGAIFGAGWTPCVGPNLAAILVLGQEGQTAALAALLLAVYSLGLGIPFLIVALAFDRVLVWMKQLRRHMSTITAVNGALLVFIGLLLLSGRLATLAQFAPPWLQTL